MVSTCVERDRGNRQRNRHRAGVSYVPADNEIIDRIERMAKALGVTLVVMESTGVYWTCYEHPKTCRFLYYGNECFSYQVCSRTMTEKKDSAWICKHFRARLLKGNYVPSRSLRDLTRYRIKLVKQLVADTTA